MQLEVEQVSGTRFTFWISGTRFLSVCHPHYWQLCRTCCISTSCFVVFDFSLLLS